jgi:hypothetical protein
MEALSNFERGQIVGACLAGASVIKTATLFGVLRVEISKVMQHIQILGRQYQQRGTVGKSQHQQKEKDCFEKSHNYCSTGDSRTEYSS